MAYTCTADVGTDENTLVPVLSYVMVDGPYSGCSIDPSAFETALFMSGGSGATFIIGLVGKCLRGTNQVVTRKSSSATLVRTPML